MAQIGIHERRLVVAGMGLFLLGLLQGILIPLLENPRMGLSAHLTAVQSGMALVVFAIPLSIGSWTDPWKHRVVTGAITGFYLIWIGITLAAMTGASRSLPIAGAGYQAGQMTEAAVALLVGSGSFVSVVAVSFLLFGLRKQ